MEGKVFAESLYLFTQASVCMFVFTPVASKMQLQADSKLHKDKPSSAHLSGNSCLQTLKTIRTIENPSCDTRQKHSPLKVL